MSSPSKAHPGVDALAGAVVAALGKSAPKKQPRKTGKRFGNTAGLTKESAPALGNRLPREKGGIIAFAGDGLTAFERALLILGPRVRETKDAYLLDGKPCNATRIMQIAGVTS